MKIDFEALTPHKIIEAVEKETGRNFLPITTALPSYINRVYELRDEDDQRWVAKFYRPGRWSAEALREEHNFIEDCYAKDIPVAAPELFQSEDSLAQSSDGFHFSLFPFMGGRLWEFREDEEQWYRLGRLLGRLHQAGREDKASHRPTLHPDHSFVNDANYLLEGDFLPGSLNQRFESIVQRIYDLIQPLFKNIPLQRIHGDFHCGNILERPGEGLMLIDFDDMAMGPAVQDFWLLLPGHASQCGSELYLLGDGYSDFLPWDPKQITLIEPLRVMRMVYYLAWCGRQRHHFRFQKQNPGWGSESFWDNEMNDLLIQEREILDHLEQDL